MSLKTKHFPIPKIANLDKKIFLDFNGFPLLCQPKPENMAKSAVALHVSNNLCLKVRPSQIIGILKLTSVSSPP